MDRVLQNIFADRCIAVHAVRRKLDAIGAKRRAPKNIYRLHADNIITNPNHKAGVVGHFSMIKAKRT